MARTHAAANAEDRAWSAAEFRDLLASPGCFAAGTPACFALVRVVADEAELLTIATEPGRRREGLARAVMRQWQAEAAARGARSAFLEVAADNAAAIALYSACGYAPTGRRRGYYRREGRPGVDALTMARALTPREPPAPAPSPPEIG